jgi:hypothetical protein
LKGFELYCAIANKAAGIADDHINDGSSLLYYRAAHFVHTYGKADPTQALKAASIVIQIPEVKALGTQLNVGPLENEKREGTDALADEKWVKNRISALMERVDLGPVLPLVTNVSLPLPGRSRFDILSDKDREDQSKARWTVLVTALQLFRQNSGNPTKLSDDDSEAASALVQEQLDRDYIQINGYFVCVRGHATECALVDVNALAKSLLDWVGPTLIELEGVKNLTIAPVESGWIVLDADTGWSMKDPTIGKFSSRDVLMLQRGLQARAHPSPATTSEPAGAAHPEADRRSRPPQPGK